jgi:hypothetical protein
MCRQPWLVLPEKRVRWGRRTSLEAGNSWNALFMGLPLIIGSLYMAFSSV